MWKDFDVKAYMPDEFLARVAGLAWNKGWTPKGITLHNTAAPTLAQWAETGPSHDARIRNLQSYYESELGWHAGPHLFISRDWINGFSNILKPGVHSRCWNSDRIGIEMVGDYAKEQFDSGDGAKVRDNAVLAVAVLNLKLGFNANDIVFHKECHQDNHDCPGKLVVKSEFIRRVSEKMQELSGKLPDVAPPPSNPAITVISPSKQGLTTIDGLNLRTGASAQSLILSMLVSDQMVEVIGEAMNADTKWLLINVGKPINKTGWVAARFVNLVGASIGLGEQWERNIEATNFGGPDDPNDSAYGGVVHGNMLEAALPFHFEGTRPMLELEHNGKTCVAFVNDVGPWNIRDPYWETGARPAAEEQHDKRLRAQNGMIPSNRAGIDLTPACFRALGVDPNAGKMLLNWRQRK